MGQACALSSAPIQPKIQNENLNFNFFRIRNPVLSIIINNINNNHLNINQKYCE